MTVLLPSQLDLERDRMREFLELPHSAHLVTADPGFGKTTSAYKRAVAVYRADEMSTILIVVENLNKTVEMKADLIAEGVSEEIITVLTGISSDNCSNSAEKIEAQRLGHSKLSEKICNECEYFCSRAEEKRALREAPFGKFVITTHAFYMSSGFIHRFINENIILILFDEDLIFTPAKDITYSEMSIEDLRHLAKIYETFSSKRISAMAQACVLASANMLTSDATDLLPLTIKDEYKLASQGVVSIYDKLIQIQKGSMRTFNRRYYFSNEVVLNGNKFIIAAVSVDKELSSVRIGHTGIHEHRIEGLPLPKGTTITRVSTSMTSMTSLKSDTNLNSVCWSFAFLIHQRSLVGKCGVVVTKVALKAKTINKMNLFLELIGSSVRLKDYRDVTEVSKDVVPVITFGIKGINSLTAYDYIFCMNSFNTTSEIVSLHLSFYYNFREMYDVKIVEENGNRSIGTNIPSEQRRVAAKLFKLYEKTTVIQAIGRIRPFTLPNKEVIVVQKSTVHPYERVINSFKKFKEAYNIPARNSFNKQQRKEQVCELLGQGGSVSEVAKRLNISRQTVYNFKGGK